MAGASFVYGQQNANTSDTIKKDKMTCQEIELKDDQRIILRKNVKIESGNLQLEADSAVFDEKTQTILAYGKKSFVFKGTLVVDPDSKKDIIRCKLKEDILYIE